MVRCARRLRSLAGTKSASAATPASAPLAAVPAAWAPAPVNIMPPAPAPTIVDDPELEAPTPVPTRGRRHRPDLVSSVPRFSVDPEPESDVPSVVTDVLPSGKEAESVVFDSERRQRALCSIRPQRSRTSFANSRRRSRPSLASSRPVGRSSHHLRWSHRRQGPPRHHGQGDVPSALRRGRAKVLARDRRHTRHPSPSPSSKRWLLRANGSLN